MRGYTALVKPASRFFSNDFSLEPLESARAIG
jgi:hypothetical protein